MRTPYVRGSATSKAAAQAQSKTAARRMRVSVYNHVLARGTDGATRDEVEAQLNRNSPQAHNARIRIRELIRMGCLVETDQTRPTRTGRHATVVYAVPGTDPARPPPPYNPIELLVQRAASHIKKGKMTLGELVDMVAEELEEE